MNEIDEAVISFYKFTNRSPNFIVISYPKWRFAITGSKILPLTYPLLEGISLGTPVGQVNVYFYSGDKVLVGIE